MNIAFKILVATFCILWISKNTVMPIAGYYLFKNDFVEQTAECSNAMDESWFAEQSKNVAITKTTNIHLLSCHEYDKTRKLMLTLGLPESILAYLGLIATELQPKTAREIAAPHRFIER